MNQNEINEVLSAAGESVIVCAPGEGNIDGCRVRLEQPVSVSFGENDQPDIPVWDAENRCPELVPPSDVDALYQPLYRALPAENPKGDGDDRP